MLKMDLGKNLIFLVIFGLFGFFISKIVGYNPYRIFSDIVAIVVILTFIIAMWPALVAPEEAIETIPNLVDVFTNAFPGILIGDVAGTIISAITD
jgi:hypothetical protein